jgi:methionyl-tRNA formyltransferase
VDIVFMGTAAFAVPSLKRLVAAPHTLLAVVTQPDRPQGRGQRLAPSPIKEVSLAHQLRTLQPPRARAAEFLAELKDLSPELIIVAAYGQLLPPALLAIPPKGCINVHASLLPRYRGAAPVNWALIRGEVVTGVTIMAMEAMLDTGPILLQAAEKIHPADNAQTLSERLAILGAEILLQALPGIESGTLNPVPQDHQQATYAPKLRKEDGFLQWHHHAVDLANLIRGVTPWPGATAMHAGRPLRIWRATAMTAAEGGHPGRVGKIDELGAWVETGQGYLVIEEVQPAGGRRMQVGAYVRGHALQPGEMLGPC